MFVKNFGLKINMKNMCISKFVLMIGLLLTLGHNVTLIEPFSYVVFRYIGTTDILEENGSGFIELDSNDGKKEHENNDSDLSYENTIEDSIGRNSISSQELETKTDRPPTKYFIYKASDSSPSIDTSRKPAKSTVLLRIVEIMNNFYNRIIISHEISYKCRHIIKSDCVHHIAILMPIFSFNSSQIGLVYNRVLPDPLNITISGKVQKYYMVEMKSVKHTRWTNMVTAETLVDFFHVGIKKMIYCLVSKHPGTINEKVFNIEPFLLMNEDSSLNRITNAPPRRHCEKEHSSLDQKKRFKGGRFSSCTYGTKLPEGISTKRVSTSVKSPEEISQYYPMRPFDMHLKSIEKNMHCAIQDFEYCMSSIRSYALHSLQSKRQYDSLILEFSANRTFMRKNLHRTVKYIDDKLTEILQVFDDPMSSHQQKTSALYGLGLISRETKKGHLKTQESQKNYNSFTRQKHEPLVSTRNESVDKYKDMYVKNIRAVQTDLRQKWEDLQFILKNGQTFIKEYSSLYNEAYLDAILPLMRILETVQGLESKIIDLKIRLSKMKILRDISTFDPNRKERNLGEKDGLLTLDYNIKEASFIEQGIANIRNVLIKLRIRCLRPSKNTKDIGKCLDEKLNEFDDFINKRMRFYELIDKIAGVFDGRLNIEDVFLQDLPKTPTDFSNARSGP